MPLAQTVEDKAAFCIFWLKKDHTASQDWKQINTQLTSKSSLTPEQMLGTAKVRCWGGFFVTIFTWRVLMETWNGIRAFLAMWSALGQETLAHGVCLNSIADIWLHLVQLSSLDYTFVQCHKQELFDVVLLTWCLLINSEKTRRGCTTFCLSPGVEKKIVFTWTWSVSVNALLLSWRPGLNKRWNLESSVLWSM